MDKEKRIVFFFSSNLGEERTFPQKENNSQSLIPLKPSSLQTPLSDPIQRERERKKRQIVSPTALITHHTYIQPTA